MTNGALRGRMTDGFDDENTPLAPDLKWLHKTIPPLPVPKAEVTNVSNFEELFTALGSALPGSTIVLADGEYDIITELVITKDNVTIRGASNDRSKVILKGNGLKGKSFIESENAIAVNGAKNVTIASLTLKGFSVHGISVQGHTGPHGVHIYNVGFYDIGQRSIKVNAQETTPPVENGVVEYCYFEQIEDIEKGRNDGFDGDYVAGIDAHQTKNWIIRDNVFRNIRGANGGGRAAIFIWNRSENATVERNLIIGCDRGIAFGNPYVPEGIPYHNKGGIIRNNMISSRDGKIGIEIVAAKDLKVYNNTVINENKNFDLAIKYAHHLSKIDIRNNLVSGGINQCTSQTGAEAFLRNNLTEAPKEWFSDPANGNITFSGKVKEVIGKAQALNEVGDDFFGKSRGKSCEIGACVVE